MRAAGRSTTLSRFRKQSKNRLSHGEIDIWIWKRKIFETPLRPEKTSSAHFGQRSIIV